MSEKQWEILEVGAELVFNEKTDTLIIKKPAIRYLLRQKE